MKPETLKSLLDAVRASSGSAVPVVMGPTAAGKSELAFALARECGGEIVSADSMQFYRGLDVGTAKPTPEERRLVPHHLIDTLDIAEKSDVFRFRADAMKAIADAAENDPESLHAAPVTTPVRRLDETTAARKPDLKYDVPV